jgi:transcriptional regulator with XRE-family HTH domain
MERILKIARTVRGYSLKELSIKSNTGINILQYYESDKHIPGDKKINILSNALNIKKELLYFSFGLLPPQIRDKVKNFPVYYMEKIIELCNDDPSKDKSEEEINFINKSSVIPYMDNFSK